jgi:hypothetical protein
MMGCGASSLPATTVHQEDGPGSRSPRNVQVPPYENIAPTVADEQPSHQEAEAHENASNAMTAHENSPAEGEKAAHLQVPDGASALQGIGIGPASPEEQASQEIQRSLAESTQGARSPTSMSGWGPFLQRTPASSTSLLLDMLRAQMNAGFNRRSEQFVRQTFERHKALDLHGIPINNLTSALADLGIAISSSECEELFKAHDLSESGYVDYSEFAAMVDRIHGADEEWASTLPLAQLLADCMPIRKEADPVQAVSRLCDTDLETIVTCFGEGLKRMLHEEIAKLKRAYARMQRKIEEASSAPAKFAVAPQMQSGSIDDFHEGLSARVGDPHLDFGKAMEAEHCSTEGSRTLFTTRNYGVTTCAYNEWRIAARNDFSLADVSGAKRRLRRIEEVLELAVVKSAKLSREEAIAVVLYTGV